MGFFGCRRHYDIPDALHGEIPPEVYRSAQTYTRHIERMDRYGEHGDDFDARVCEHNEAVRVCLHNSFMDTIRRSLGLRPHDRNEAVAWAQYIVSR